jgi:hypothetical protein
MMNNLWLWLVIGFVPYYIGKQQVRGKQKFEVRAVFWSLEVLQPCRGSSQWKLRIPLKEQFGK